MNFDPPKLGPPNFGGVKFWWGGRGPLGVPTDQFGAKSIDGGPSYGGLNIVPRRPPYVFRPDNIIIRAPRLRLLTTLDGVIASGVRFAPPFDAWILLHTVMESRFFVSRLRDFFL